MSGPNPPERKAIFETPKPMDTERPKQDRFTAHLTGIHEHCCESPIPINPQFVRLLETTEQVWVRRQRINCTPVPVDLGWLKDSPLAYLVIVNGTGNGAVANPTDEEKRRIDESVVMLRYNGDRWGWAIRPRGEFFAGEAESPSNLVLSCLHPVEVTVYAIPG